MAEFTASMRFMYSYITDSAVTSPLHIMLATSVAVSSRIPVLPVDSPPAAIFKRSPKSKCDFEAIEVGMGVQ